MKIQLTGDPIEIWSKTNSDGTKRQIFLVQFTGPDGTAKKAKAWGNHPVAKATNGATIETEVEVKQDREGKNEDWFKDTTQKKGFGSGGGFKGTPRNERAIIAQNSMGHATALVCAGKIPLDQLSAYAQKVMGWVCKAGNVPTDDHAKEDVKKEG